MLACLGSQGFRDPGSQATAGNAARHMPAARPAYLGGQLQPPRSIISSPRPICAWKMAGAVGVFDVAAA